MKREEVAEIVGTTTNINIFLLNMGLKMRIPCHSCGIDTPLTLEKLTYICRRRNNKTRCNFKKAVLLQGLCGKKRYTIKEYLLVIYEWCENTTTRKVAYNTKVSQSSVKRLYNHLNFTSAKHMTANGPQEIGGEGVVVEIDESKFYKRKNNKGRILAGEGWIFGGIVRGSWDSYFFEFVRDRKIETLAEVIARKIAPGSEIHSDEWPAYKGVMRMLNAYDFIHKTVCHKTNFKDPNTGVHTQNIEAFWSVMKREMRKNGTSKGSKDNVLGKMHATCFKRKYCCDSFEMIVKELLK